jgi:hypothetical protein
MSREPGVRPVAVTAGDDAEKLRGSERWIRARWRLGVPSALVALLVRDPQHTQKV